MIDLPARFRGKRSHARCSSTWKPLTVRAPWQFPAGGPNSRALYKVNDRAATTGPSHNFRILMTDNDLDKMFTETNYLSNQRMGATVIWNENQVYYDVDVRFKGSGFSRGSTATGLNLSFPRQQLLFGEHDTVAVDRQGAVWGLGEPGGTDDQAHRQPCRWHPDDVRRRDPVAGARDSMNGSAQLMLARYNDVFLESQFDNGGEGTRYKYELIYYSTQTVDQNRESLKLPPGDFDANKVFPVKAIDMAFMGDDPDAYRWYFLIRNQRTGTISRGSSR